jgi:hypothetical protein
MIKYLTLLIIEWIVFLLLLRTIIALIKMIELQIAQLAASVPPTDKGKIPGQLKELETANLVDIFNAGWYYK